MAAQIEGTIEKKKATLRGENLAELMLRARNASGMSQSQVAAKLKEKGEDAGPASVSRAEKGEGPRHVSKAKREALARGYELHFVLVPVGAGEGDEVVEDEAEMLISRVESSFRAAVAKLRELQQHKAKAAIVREGNARPARRARSTSTAGGHTHA